jgi:hypothetical protein
MPHHSFESPRPPKAELSAQEQLENIYLKLATIKDGYSRYIGEGQVRMSLVKVHPERVQDEVNASESTALFDNLERLLDVNVLSILDM